MTSIITGAGQKSLLVDTGSGYSTISQDTLKALQESGEAIFLRKMQGIMADGSHHWVSVYRIAGLNIGGNCQVKNIEVAVFPNGGREILGLSALGKVSPFTFSIEPPRLSLSNCNRI
ncbi:MAG: retroviral-like aspartic protease family protein [Methylococcales bacterium]